MNYNCLFTQDILKYTDRAGLDTTALRRACDAMCIVPKAASDMMQVGQLQGFDVSNILLVFFPFTIWGLPGPVIKASC